jgi:tetratricopeptide (TPR) repeat protein
MISLSGLTLISFAGLVLLKPQDSPSSSSTTTNSESPFPDHQSLITPTQVPKSIQHYLLASQQYFSQALQQQNSPSTNNSQPTTIDLLNQSLLAATEAIKLFPSDYRGYEQRARIYHSLIDSQPQLLPAALNDYTLAFQLNPTSAELTRQLASLSAKKGDVTQTLAYLTQTVNLEPTKAQNFYDLARLQQQSGQIDQALLTYNRLLPLITDTKQLSQVQSEKTALEKLLSQVPPLSSSSISLSPSSLPSKTPQKKSPPSLQLDSPTLQADSGSSLIVAAPNTSDHIEITSQTNSNSLSGNATLNSGQSQLTLTNTNLKTTSQIYLTTTKGGKNLSLQVLSRSQDSFTVGLDSPAPENIEFKWWIINP